jgi:hypothetical protein
MSENTNAPAPSNVTDPSVALLTGVTRPATATPATRSATATAPRTNGNSRSAASRSARNGNGNGTASRSATRPAGRTAASKPAKPAKPAKVATPAAKPVGVNAAKQMLGEVLIKGVADLAGKVKITKEMAAAGITRESLLTYFGERMAYTPGSFWDDRLPLNASKTYGGRRNVAAVKAANDAAAKKADAAAKRAATAAAKKRESAAKAG